ncbi:MAG: SRPBCC family protein [Candidatus Nanopelagicales bacterium]|jgi:hypothetical protein|nr:SRPBCC family protein [Candidatus Nanopelagicales bacterium]
MAHYRATLTSTAPVRETFERLADFASVADWDPSIPEARLTSGEPGQVGSHYTVAPGLGPARMPLDYTIVARQDPHDDQPGSVMLVADAGLFTSRDTITVRSGAMGAEVTYDAQLNLHGLARFMDIPVHLGFQVVGRLAEAGLRKELDRLGATAGR